MPLRESNVRGRGRPFFGPFGVFGLVGFAAACLAAIPTAAAPAQMIPILVYHRFDLDKAGPTTVRTSTFEG